MSPIAVATRRNRIVRPPSVTIRNGLVAYWRLDEASGTRFDAIGANHLSDNNTVTQAVGKAQFAGQFTAANSEFLSIADNPTLSWNMNQSFTISCWVYFDALAVDQAMVAKFGGGAAEYVLSYDTNAGINKLRFAVYDTTASGTPDKAYANGIGTPATATWHHLVAGYCRASHTIWIVGNGSAPDSVAVLSTPIGDTAAAFRIGSLDGTQWFMNGRIDGVGFWRRRPTPTEIAWLYNSGNGRDIF